MTTPDPSKKYERLAKHIGETLRYTANEAYSVCNL